jgi:hypothetical protein
MIEIKKSLFLHLNAYLNRARNTGYCTSLRIRRFGHWRPDRNGLHGDLDTGLARSQAE